jgi:hypothetical protein
MEKASFFSQQSVCNALSIYYSLSHHHDFITLVLVQTEGQAKNLHADKLNYTVMQHCLPEIRTQTLNMNIMFFYPFVIFSWMPTSFQS